MRGWLNFAAPHDLLGEWHDEHDVPKCFDGARWQDAQRDEAE